MTIALTLTLLKQIKPLKIDNEMKAEAEYSRRRKISHGVKMIPSILILQTTIVH